MTRSVTSSTPSDQLPLIPVVSAGGALRGLVVRATAWTLLATYGGQALRLVSNLILTRLLFPEAFGVMAVIHLVLQGLNLFSDIGIQQSLIQDPRGEEQWFNNTAWTMQVVRGVVLWLAACAIAAVLHVATISGWLAEGSALADPRVVWFLPVAGLTLIAVGLHSTKLIMMRRRMMLGYEAVFQLSYQCVQMIIIVVWAWLHPSIWALLGGTVVSAIVAAMASHVLLPGSTNRFAWNRVAAGHLLRFGRYIFVATMFTFVGLHAQRLILGTILASDLFGVFSIALVLSTVVLTAVDRLHGCVLFPLYSQLARRNDPVALGANVNRVRLRLLAMSLPPMWLVAIFGEQIVGLLYDTRYHEAGWMLQVLAVGAIITLVSITVRPIMLAHGHSGRHLAYTAICSIVLSISMAFGGYFHGVMGVLVGAVVAEFIGHLVLLGFARRYMASTFQLDMACLGLSAAVIAMGTSLLRG